MNYTEFFKLIEMLTGAGIPYLVLPCHDGRKISIYSPRGEEIDDAVIHSYSHGGSCGLLEAYHVGNCDGYQLAEDIFPEWVAMYHESCKK